MSVVKLDDNSLVLINPIKLNDEMIKKINSLGKVSYIFNHTTHHCRNNSFFYKKMKNIRLKK